MWIWCLEQELNNLIIFEAYKATFPNLQHLLAIYRMNFLKIDIAKYELVWFFKKIIKDML